jgi:hypothetical protein
VPPPLRENFPAPANGMNDLNNNTNHGITEEEKNME